MLKFVIALVVMDTIAISVLGIHDVDKAVFIGFLIATSFILGYIKILLETDK